MNSKGNKRWVGMFTVVALGLMALTGCATAPVRSGYLGNYEGFMPDPKDKSLLWWEKADFDWRHYRQILLDPVRIRIAPKLERQFTSEELNALTEYFEKTVHDALGQKYPVVNEPGPDVLRIRAAITDIDPSNPALNLLTTAVVFVPVDMGGASLEAEFLDSVTGERLAAMVDRKTGTPIQLAGGFKRLGHAKAAFETWAEELKIALDTNP